MCRAKTRLNLIRPLNFIKLILFIGIIGIPGLLRGQPIFIFRPQAESLPLTTHGQIRVRGELFGYLLFPSNFPSFNDLSGSADRWNFGFQNIIDLTPTTSLLAQLNVHDNSTNRTKFDWHFSLRQNLGPHIVLILGHDSNHDSDHVSQLNGKDYYLNRNYLGFGLNFASSKFLFEPFFWLMHHTNQRSHLDFSGERLRQEFGFRLGLALTPQAILSCQVIFQSDTLLARGQSLLADLIFRLRVARWLELSAGGNLWQDMGLSRLGNQKSFYKVMWGLVIPF